MVSDMRRNRFSNTDSTFLVQVQSFRIKAGYIDRLMVDIAPLISIACPQNGREFVFYQLNYYLFIYSPKSHDKINN